MSELAYKAGQAEARAKTSSQQNQYMQQGLSAVAGGIENIFQKRRQEKQALEAALEAKDNKIIQDFLSQIYLDDQTGRIKEYAIDYINDLENLPASVLARIDLETAADGSLWDELYTNTSVDKKSVQRFIDKGYFTQWRDQELVPSAFGIQATLMQTRGQYYYEQEVVANMEESVTGLLEGGVGNITEHSVSAIMEKALSFAAKNRDYWGGYAVDPDGKNDVSRSPEARTNYVWQFAYILSQDYLKQRMDNEDIQSYTQVQAIVEEFFDQTLVPAAKHCGADIRSYKDQYMSKMADPNSGYAMKIATANYDKAQVEKKQAVQALENVWKTGEVLSNDDKQALIISNIPGSTAASKQALTEINIMNFGYDRRQDMSRMNKNMHIDIQQEDGTVVPIDISLDALFAGDPSTASTTLLHFVQEESGLVTLPDGRTLLTPYSELLGNILDSDGFSDEEKMYFINSFITGISQQQEKAAWTNDQIGRQRLLLSDEDFTSLVSRLYRGGLIDYDAYSKWMTEEEPSRAKARQTLINYLDQQLVYLNALNKKNDYKLEDVLTIDNYKAFEQYLLNHNDDISEDDIKNFASSLIQQRTDIINADILTEVLKWYGLVSNMANGGPINVALFDNAYSGGFWSFHKGIMDGSIIVDNDILSETLSMIASMDANSLKKNLSGMKDTLAERLSGIKGMSYKQSNTYIKNTVNLYLAEALFRESNFMAISMFSGEPCIEVPAEKNGQVELGYMRSDGVIFVPQFGSVNNLGLFKATPEQVKEIKASGSQFVPALHFTENDFFATYSFKIQNTSPLDEMNLREKMGIFQAERNTLTEMFANPAFFSQEESEPYAQRFSDLSAYKWLTAIGDQAVSDEELREHEAEINAYISSIDDSAYNSLKGRNLLPRGQVTKLPLSSDNIQLNVILNGGGLAE